MPVREQISDVPFFSDLGKEETGALIAGIEEEENFLGRRGPAS